MVILSMYDIDILHLILLLVFNLYNNWSKKKGLAIDSGKMFDSLKKTHTVETRLKNTDPIVCVFLY